MNVVSRKTAYVALALTLLVGGYALLHAPLVAQLKRTETLDTMGKIRVAISRTLGAQPSEQYDASVEARKLFPDLPTKAGRIVDGWGNPIEISISRSDQGFDIRFTSPGRDGRWGTGDDVVESYSISEK